MKNSRKAANQSSPRVISETEEAENERVVVNEALGISTETAQLNGRALG